MRTIMPCYAYGRLIAANNQANKVSGHIGHQAVKGSSKCYGKVRRVHSSNGT